MSPASAASALPDAADPSDPPVSADSAAPFDLDDLLARGDLSPRRLGAAAEDLRGAGALRRAAELCQRAAQRAGGSRWFTAGKALLHVGDLREAEAALRRYLREAEAAGARPPGPDDDPEASPVAARHLLGCAALLDGQLRLAERWLKEALDRAEGLSRTAIACDLGRVWLRARRLDRAIGLLHGLSDLAEPETYLLGAEVAVMLGDLRGALPLCRAALDPRGRDDRAAALLATLLLRLDPANLSPALALLPVLPGRRFDTLAVRLFLLRLAGQGALPEVGAATRSAEAALRHSLPPPLRQGSSGEEPVL